MKRLFGEFLTQEKIISEEQLLQGLLLQLEESPTMAKVVSDLKLLSHAEMLVCLKEQAVSACSFVDAAKKHGLWKEGFAEKAYAKLFSLRTPLGEILVREGFMNLSALTRALDDFLGAGLEKADEQESKTSEAEHASDSTLFAEGFLQNFGSLAEKFPLVTPEHLNEMADGLHRILGAAKIFDFEALTSPLEAVEKTLRYLKQIDLNKLDNQLAQKIHGVLQETKVFLQTCAMNEATLKQHMETAEFTKGKQQLEDLCMVINFDLEFLLP